MGGGASSERQRQLNAATVARNQQKREDNLEQALLAYRKAGIVPEEIAASTAAALEAKYIAPLPEKENTRRLGKIEEQKPPRLPKLHNPLNPSLPLEYYRHKVHDLRQKRMQRKERSQSPQRSSLSPSKARHDSPEDHDKHVPSGQKQRPSTAPGELMYMRFRIMSTIQVF